MISLFKCSLFKNIFLTVVLFSTAFIYAQDIEYEMEKTDTLYGLSRKYHVPIEQIIERNNIEDPNSVKAGQILYIPTTKPDVNLYKVKSGDTISAIAVKFNSTSDMIRKINNLEETSLIKVGQVLKVPNENEKITPAKVEDSHVVEKDLEYTVKKGDSLLGIALKFNTNPKAIRKLNNLKDDTIWAGQILVIKEAKNPVLLKDSEFYIVSKGDTLSGIAVKFGVDEEKIKEANDLESDMLKLGQKLEIPKEGLGTLISYSEERIFSDEILGWPHPGARSKAKGKTNGVIITASENDKVISVSDGVVVHSDDTNLGKVIIIQSDKGYIYVYGGNKETEVKKGDKVSKGEEIARLGKLPLNDKVELYFSIWRNGVFLNPEEVIKE